MFKKIKTTWQWWTLEDLTVRFVLSSQQEEKDRETPKDSLDDLFPNDEEEHGQGSKNNSVQHDIMIMTVKPDNIALLWYKIL